MLIISNKQMESKDSKKQHEQLDEAAVNMTSAQIVAVES